MPIVNLADILRLKGPGLDSNNLKVGADSASNYGWHHNWPGGWNTYGKVTYCAARYAVQDYPSTVLPTASSTELKAGMSSQAPFSVSIECESGAVSSTNASTTSSANVAMGFLVNQPTAVNSAQQLGLVTSGGEADMAMIAVMVAPAWRRASGSVFTIARVE
jgi:hypothetical protein